MQRYQNNFSKAQGNSLRPVAGASVLVTTIGGAVATIYSDNGVTTTTNPLTTDANGMFAFYAADGRYSLTITSSETATVVVSDILLEDPQDGSPMVINGGTISDSAISGGTVTDSALSNITIDGVAVAGSDIAKYSRLNDADGADLIGFSYAVSYAAGTIGKWLKDLATSAGATFIGFIQSGIGAVARSVQDKLRERITPQDFMTDAQRADVAAGTALLDVTTPLQDAINEAVSTGKALHLIAGRYRTSGTLTATVSTAQNLKIIGDGFGKSIIVKNATNADPVMRIGSAAATAFTSNVDIQDFTLEGAGTSATSIGLELYDVVQSRLKVRARVCGIGVKSNGGISLDMRGSDLSNNLTGFQGTKFTSLAGGGWPNLIRLDNSHIKNNTQRGVDFDFGRLLTLYGCDIESNGTSGDANTAGVWVGSNIGQESGLLSTGVNIGDGTWLEANAGRSAVVFQSGRNTIKDAYFVANANATNDVYVSGGRYVLKDSDFDTNKAANIEEAAGVLSKNYIINCDYNAATIDATKTIVWDSASGLQNSAILATTMTATGQVSLAGAAGAEAFRAKTQAGAVARVFAKGATTGAPAQLGFEGETNTGAYIVTSGTGIYQFTTGGGAYEQVRITNTTGADRSLILTGGTVDSFISSTAGGVRFGAVPKLPTYTVATLPAAANNLNGVIYVSDGASNKRLAVCDGTNWRWPDGAIVS